MSDKAGIYDCSVTKKVCPHLSGKKLPMKQDGYCETIKAYCPVNWNAFLKWREEYGGIEKQREGK